MARKASDNETKKKPSGCSTQGKFVNGLTKNQMKMYDIFFWIERVDINDPKAVAERIDMFRQVCSDLRIVPTLSDLAVAMQIPRPSLISYRDGTTKCPKETREALQRTSLWLESSLAQVGWNNPMYSTYVIWLQKNYFGFRDAIDLNVNQNALPDNESAQEVLQRRKFVENSLVPPELEDHQVIDAEFTAVDTPEATEAALNGAVEELPTEDELPL